MVGEFFSPSRFPFPAASGEEHELWGGVWAAMGAPVDTHGPAPKNGAGPGPSWLPEVQGKVTAPQNPQGWALLHGAASGTWRWRQKGTAETKPELAGGKGWG